MIATLAAKELKQLFATPLAWLVLGITQLVLAWLLSVPWMVVSPLV